MVYTISTADIESLRKEAWKYGNVQRDTKTKVCEYSLLMFRMDTIEDTIRCMKRNDNRQYGLSTIFQLTEHTMFSIQLLKDNKIVYGYTIQQQIKKAFQEIQELIVYYQYDKAIEIIKNIRNIARKHIVC